MDPFRIDSATWSLMREQAGVLLKSGLLPSSIRSPEAAVAVMLQGYEMGIGPMAALQTINVIGGKPSISPQLMLALIHRTGLAESIEVTGDEKRAAVTIKRVGHPAHTETFRIEDAAAMGLASRENWQRQPAVMLRWRAVAACARVTFPDAILGLYTPEEMGAEVAVDELGDMQVVAAPVAPAEAPLPVHPQANGEHTSIVSSQDPAWQAWQKLVARARATEGVPFESIAPPEQAPISISELRARYRELSDRLRGAS